MDKDKINELGDNWKTLNERYDNLIVELIDASEPAPLSLEKLDELKELQDELLNLEGELFQALQGE